MRATPRLVVIALLLAAVCRQSLFAQRHGAPPPMRPPSTAVPRLGPSEPARETPIEDFERMSAEEQRHALEKLPPDRRKKFEDQLARYRSMTSEEREALNETYRRLSALSPDRQEAVRKSVQKFGTQPAARQQAMREELRRLAALPAKERKDRMKSPEFRDSFSSEEKHTIRDMLELLPPPESRSK